MGRGRNGSWLNKPFAHAGGTPGSTLCRQDAAAATGSRCSFLRITAPTSVDADRHVARDGHSSMQSRLLAVVVDRDVLGGAVIPNRDIAHRPSPSHRVLEARHISLQQREELFRIGLRQIDKVPQESSQHERPLAGSGMHAHDGMFRFVNGGRENVEVAFQLVGRGLRRHRIVVRVAECTAHRLLAISCSLGGNDSYAVAVLAHAVSPP